MSDSEIPSEGSILRSTLIPPSGLPAVISLKDFTVLFPASLRTHAQIPALYRALQHERALDLDFVSTNIDAEVKRGERQQRELLRAKIKGAGGTEGLDVDETGQERGVVEEQEGLMDDLLYSQQGVSAFKPHTLTTIIHAMDNAIGSMETEVVELDSAADQLQSQLESSLGDLSDLRYGKLSRPGLRKEVIEGLKSLAAECDRQGAADVELHDA